METTTSTYNCDSEKGHNEQQDCIALLTEALSNATHVAGNESFDPNDHPTGCITDHRHLRAQLEQRWNDLIVATTTAASTTTTSNSSSGRSSQEEGNEDDPSSPSSPSSSMAWFEKIYDRHTESGRYYHTAVHLWEMFELLDILMNIMSNKNKNHSSYSYSYSSSKCCWWYVPMAWSVFFHDAIYDPKSNRNETDSAELFREFCGYDDDEEEEEGQNKKKQQDHQQAIIDGSMTTIAMNKVTFDAAMTMILATEKHEVILPPTTTTATEEDGAIAMQKYFLDIDMAVLGKHKTAYRMYAALIRKEYSFVPHDVYCSKRAEILDTFLNGNSNSNSNSSNNNDTSTTKKKHIYLTQAFRDAFENRARENLREEIKLLRKNVIPG